MKGEFLDWLKSCHLHRQDMDPIVQWLFCAVCSCALVQPLVDCVVVEISTAGVWSDLIHLVAAFHSVVFLATQVTRRSVQCPQSSPTVNHAFSYVVSRLRVLAV
jgi:hypothetical protein